MHEEMICQGRSVSASELTWLRSWLSGQREKSRHSLAMELCRRWQWQTATGRLKNYAARSFLIKLERQGFIELPPIRESMRRRTWLQSGQCNVVAPADEIVASLKTLKPISILIPSSGSAEEVVFRSYLATHHYLGFSKNVGENLGYLVQDRQGRDLACLLFGAAAWKIESRDRWIGWNDAQRQKNLSTLTNNTRFLILPWIKVPHLASHILGNILRRLSSDWHKKYGHPIHLVETFVEKIRFRGTCYQASNWAHVGETKGRSRQDRNLTLHVPVKDIYLYPLHCNFREAFAC